MPKQIYFCDKLEANKFMDILANSRDYSFLNNYNHFKINDNYVLQFGDSSNDIIIYLHGGAYIKEIFPEHIKLCEKIAKETNKMVLAPLYPLAPKYKYQDAYNMVLKLYMRYIDHNIYFIGDSAGGGLALGLAEYLCNEKYEMPKELILISPWLDVSLGH